MALRESKAGLPFSGSSAARSPIPDIDKSWDPFGPGWFGEKDSRIYEIVYRDRDGRVHRDHVKTSMMSGVYLTNDRIVEDRPKRSVEEEKAELRRRLAELEQK